VEKGDLETTCDNTFQAQVGMITGCTAKEFAGHYSPTAKAEASQLELKIKCIIKQSQHQQR